MFLLILKYLPTAAGGNLPRKYSIGVTGVETLVPSLDYISTLCQMSISQCLNELCLYFI